MADRRMLHKKVVESDPFYNLSEGAQSIYMHLTMNADDDGFVNNAQSIAVRFKSGAVKLKELVDKRFLLQFGDVYVLKHWRIGNSLKSDRTKPPTYPGIASAIWIKPNRAYTDHPEPGYRTLLETKTGIQLESKRNPTGIQMESQQKRTEEKGTERKGNELNSTEQKRTPEADFQEIWMNYPEDRRGTMQLAYEAFRTEITSEEEADTALENLRLWKQSQQWNKEDGTYIPYLDNWITRGTWRIKPSKMATAYGASGELGEAELEAIRRVLAEDIE